VLLVLLTTLMTPIVIYSSFGSIKENAHLYMGFLLLLETGWSARSSRSTRSSSTSSGS
jgi:NADH:ubiquinone oxidoreductase subunit 4 (subunit M)